MEDVDSSEAVLHVHIVEARAAQNDHAHAQRMEPVDDGGVHLVVDENAHRVRVLCKVHSISGQAGVEEFDLKFAALIRLLKGGLVIGSRVKKSNFH